MSVPSTCDELIQLIRKSGMLDEQKLASYLQRRQLGRGPLPNDAREAADAMVADGILTNFQSEQFLLGKWRGFTIGKFKLLERVGVGGMGQVFLCEHMFMKRRVAVKVLPPAKAEQPAALGRFYREARAAGSLDHPNIVRTHDIDQDGNLHFIVMEYVDGSNLLEIVKKFGPMDIRRACSYIKQVATGLDFAFRNGIIHRDVKPGNILIDRRGVARVLDMGLARFYKDTTDLLTVKYDDKIVLGTADYVAPEQVANSHSVDVRADIYGLGATFYFLLAGHPPFPTGTVSQKLLWHRTKEPTPIRQIRPEVPEELAEIVSRMMAKDPSRRCQTPGEVMQLLAPWVPPGVPMPAAAEMPQMCPAVQEILDSAAELSDRMVQEELVGVGAAVGVAEAPAHQPGSRSYPIGNAAATKPASSIPAPINPFGPAPTSARTPVGPPASSVRPMNGHALNTPVPMHSPLRPGMGSGELPPTRRSQTYNNTSMPADMVRESKLRLEAELDQTPSAGLYKVLMYLILIASLIVGSGLVALKFAKPQPAAEPLKLQSQGPQP